MIKINPKRCPQNHKCPLIKMCPENAISQEGFGLPKIDEEKCVECMICVKNCPRKAVEKIE